MSTGSRNGMLSAIFADKQSLYKNFMSYLKNGGIFVPTTRQFHLLDEVFVLVTLPEEAERRPVSGRVAWISPSSHSSGRPQGIGVQFLDSPENDELRNRIEILLAGMSSNNPTHTM